MSAKLYPTPLTDNEDRYTVAVDPAGLGCEEAVRIDFARQLERDCLVMAMCLYFRPASSMSPEAQEVVEKWRPRVDAVVAEGCK